MRRTSVLFLSASACVSLAFGQQTTTLQGFSTVIPLHNSTNTAVNAVTGSLVPPIPMWTYSAIASPDLGGATYTGTIMGRSPYLHGKTTTTVPLQIVPLIVKIDNSNTEPGDVFTYDPTLPDPCVAPGVHTPIDVVTGSPLLQNNNWVMNGVNVGNTQYIDAFQRAEFWSLVGGSTYHLVFNPSVLAPQVLSFGSNGSTIGVGENFRVSNPCSPIGVVNVNDMDAALQNLITGPLAGAVNAGTFPVFLTRNVVMSQNGDSVAPGDCCILGYHSAMSAGGSDIQVYSPFDVDTLGEFGGGYTSVMAHEIGEAVNDPTGNNPTPNWGNVGQVLGGCQNNLEVGDPLSPNGGATPTSPFTVAGANGLTYSLQELAYYSWFYGGPNLGAGGKYSNNGSFGGHAVICPPGGTN